ncbi:hypothetical protein [Arthrobacter sp. H14]|uniref:hypothetical protein n=1 Tax=Arthrobacter sp. H14 TaxID=1312959 RepID=UPI00047D9086|nr:hypothetical protein [Arthrobacter sp. H14]
MTVNQNRVSRGVSSGGQFSATAHAEPALSLVSPSQEQTTQEATAATAAAVHAEVEANRPDPSALRRRKTPVLDFLRKRPGSKMPETNTKDVNRWIHDLQTRLQEKR